MPVCQSRIDPLHERPSPSPPAAAQMPLVVLIVGYVVTSLWANRRH
jgi:hypothetical protein